MKTRLLIITGIIIAVAISGALYATSFDNADADDIHKGIGKTEIWEPGPTDGFTPTEIPAHQYQEAQERPSYTEALSSGSIVLASESPKLSDKQLDNVMDELLHSELDRFILPIASIAIDYDRDILVLWTPDLTIGNKVKAIVGDVPFVLLYEEAPPRWEHDGPEEQKEMPPTTTYYDPARYYEIFTETGPLGLLGVNEKGDVTSGSPLLSEINCMRYANWLTEFQKKKIDVSEDYPRYPPWGNEIFPLVDYCLANGDLIKTIVNDKIQWSFSGISGNSEPEFKDEKITIIKISKGEIVSEKAIKFNGWTNQPNQEIMLTVTAPNGNVISTGKLSSMNNGTFADSITTGGPLWKQQDGIYLVTVQQGNDPTNSAYFELDLKDGNIITGK